MFTDRFIRVPIEMYNKTYADLTGDDEGTTFEAFMKLNPMEIISYRPKYDKDQNEEDKTIVDLKNTEDFIVLMSFREFERLLNEKD